ncbi:MAG: hypothetical protein ACJAVM_003049 [Sulfitobacter sp.]|jgi:hypothetical protein
MTRKPKAKKPATTTAYRETVLQGLGRVNVPAHLSDAEVLQQITQADDAP